MLTIAFWALMVAFGRVTRQLSPLPFVILLIGAVVLTALTSDLVDLPFPAQVALNFFGMLIIFLIGFFVGRWLDRDKYED